MKKISFILAVTFIFNILAGTVLVSASHTSENENKTEVASITFGANDYADGITATGGENDEYGRKIMPYKLDSNESGIVYKKTPETSKIEFDIVGETGYNDYYVEVEYYEFKQGRFYIEYINKNYGKTKTELLCMINDTAKEDYIGNADAVPTVSGTKTFRLNNVDVSGDVDFKIETIRENVVVETYAFPRCPVYIKSVKVYKANTPLKLSTLISTPKVGNIFYDNELAEFDVTLNETLGYAVDLDIIVNAYKYSGSDGINNVKESTPIISTTKSLSLKAGESRTETFNFNIGDYGLYVLDVDILQDNVLFDGAEAEFSKCVRNTTTNKKLGANVHSVSWYDNENYMKLMANAGMGIARDGLDWYKYDVSTGTKEDEPVYAMPYDFAEWLTLCEKYDIDPMVILYSFKTKYNSSYIGGMVNEENIGYYKDYLTNFLQEPSMQNVKMLEIQNEPVRGRFNYGDYGLVSTPPSGVDEKEFYKAKGEAYGKIAEAANEVIKISSVNVPVGILSNCDLGPSLEGRAIWFADGALNYLNNKNVLGNFSAATYHPYAYYFIPELTQKALLKHSYATADKYGFDTVGDWHTEIGWSTAKYKYNAACIGDEMKQATNLLRQYASVMNHNANDKFVMYNMVDDEIVLNEQESNYGLVHSEKYSVPYAAKYSYLAISNLNRLTQNAVDVDMVFDSFNLDNYTPNWGNGKDENLKGSRIYRFNGETITGKDVYMMYTNKTDGDTVTCEEIPEDGVVYYDMVGNKLSDSEVSELREGNSFKLTTSPIYGVVGGVERAEFDIEDNYFDFTVAGTSEQCTNELVVLYMSSRDVGKYTDLKADDFQYIDATTASENGDYRFRGALTTGSDTLYAYLVKAGDGEQISRIIVRRPVYGTQLLLLSGYQKQNINQIVLGDLMNVQLTAVLETIPSGESAVLIKAFYAGNTLDSTSITDISAVEDLTDETISVPSDKGVDKVKIFLWNTEKLYPLCEALFVDKE